MKNDKHTKKLGPKSERDEITSAGTRIGAEDNAALVCDADDGGTHGVRSIKIHVEIHGGECL